MNRGLAGQKTKPTADAPSSTASLASSARVIPQILTNITATHSERAPGIGLDTSRSPTRNAS